MGILFRSQSVVVCEREQIPAGSQVSFAVDCVLPDAIPPTLRGSAMRYGYALVVVVKFPDAEVPHVVRVPFRVLPATHATGDPASLTTGSIPVPTPRDVGPRPNRFLQHDDATALRISARLLKSAPPDDIEIALALSMNGRLTDYKPDVEHQQIVGDDADRHVISPSYSHADDGLVSPLLSFDDVAGYRMSTQGLRVYSVTRGTDPVARVYVPKRVHHLGDSICVMFDFHGDRACYRIGARLEMQEVVAARYAVGYQESMATATATATAMAVAAAGAGDSTADGFTSGGYSSFAEGGDGGTGTEGPDTDGVVFRKVFGDYGEFVGAARNTEISFSIPHDAPASFSTGVITVRWLLHFLFVIPQAHTRESTHKHVDSGGGFTENGGHAQGVPYMLDPDVAEADEELMERLRLDENSEKAATDVDTDEGWKGGAWKGENPNFWTHLPDQDVDVLRWTLPIFVSGQPGSQWGTRSINRISYVSLS